MSHKHSEGVVLQTLNRKRDVIVFESQKLIQVLTGENPKSPAAGDIGIHTWGKIDYLCNHCGYRQMYVGEFSKF